MSFHVGQDVVCVDDSGIARGRLALQVVYKITRATNCDFVSVGATGDALWFGYRFRPIVSRSTDTGMAILRQILADHKAPVKEKA